MQLKLINDMEERKAFSLVSSINNTQKNFYDPATHGNSNTHLNNSLQHQPANDDLAQYSPLSKQTSGT